MAARIIGIVLTLIGIILLAYSLIYGAINGKIGSEEGLTSTSIAVLIGWFMVLIGPAIWVGETPIAIKERIRR